MLGGHQMNKTTIQGNSASFTTHVQLKACDWPDSNYHQHSHCVSTYPLIPPTLLVVGAVKLMWD